MSPLSNPGVVFGMGRRSPRPRFYRTSERPEHPHPHSAANKGQIPLADKAGICLAGPRAGSWLGNAGARGWAAAHRYSMLWGKCARKNLRSAAEGGRSPPRLTSTEDVRGAGACHSRVNKKPIADVHLAAAIENWCGAGSGGGTASELEDCCIFSCFLSRVFGRVVTPSFLRERLNAVVAFSSCTRCFSFSSIHSQSSTGALPPGASI